MVPFQILKYVMSQYDNNVLFDKLMYDVFMELGRGFWTFSCMTFEEKLRKDSDIVVIGKIVILIFSNILIEESIALLTSTILSLLFEVG